MTWTPSTFVRGPETTEMGNVSRRVRDVSDTIQYLDPDAAPFTVMLMKASSRAAMNSKFEWIEKQLPSKWDAINNAGGYSAPYYTTPDTVFAVHNPIFSVGDVVLVPRTGEKMLVSSINTGASPTTITVVRDVTGVMTGDTGAAGSGTAGVLVNNDDLLVIGTSFAEGSSSPQEKTWNETYPYNYTQIYKDAFGVSDTEERSELYTGKDRPRLRLERGIEHKINLERSALFGDRYLNNANPANVYRYTGGLTYFLQDNMVNAGGILTEPTMESWLQGVFAHVGATDTRVLFASPLVISVLDMIAVARLHLVPRDETFGITVRQWVTSHGVLNVIKHRLLETSPTGYNTTPAGYGGYAFAVDPTKVLFRYMNGRNTRLETDIQLPDEDGWKDQYLTEAGWQISLSPVHGILSGVTG